MSSPTCNAGRRVAFGCRHELIHDSGWSTTLLTSKGSLHTCGVLDGMQIIHNHRTVNGPEALRFPVGFPYSTQLAAYEEPTIAIRQFSAGRTHILALSDSGRIWSWYAVHKPALHVKFLNVDLTEASSGESSAADKPLYGRVKQVVAGWSRSSAYIYGTGIVVWDTVHRAQTENDEMDTMLVMENAEVPKTEYQRPKGAYRETEEEKALGQEVGAVLSYIILEAFVVFVTDNGKIFCGKFGDKHHVEQILELRALRNHNGIPSDVQGSFRSFAIFKDGEVITTNQDYLEACWNVRHDTDNDHSDIGGLKRIPALQHKDVISVAFGDYHFLALHSDGKITSYGTEVQGCGALGLGGDGDPEGRTRGIRYQGFSHDGKLLPHCYTTGRQVWFEEEKKQWIRFITSGGKDPAEAKERMRLFVQDANVQGEVSEWFEQQGRDWDKDPELKEYDQDGLGSYFALSISAAGWHSGAVVLVNDNLAAHVREKCVIQEPDAPAEDDKEEKGTETQASGSSGLIATYSSWLAGLGRAFLGLPPADQQTPQNVLEEDLPPRHNPNGNFLDPINHGASPGKGYKYVWADKSFPRLRLSNGQEMPGTVEFDEWRFERPEWDLTVDV